MLHCQTPLPWLSDAEKASRKIKKDQRTAIIKHLHNAVASLSLTHNVTPKYINDMISSQTKYHTAHKVTLANALIHAKAKEVNNGKPNYFAFSCSYIYILLQQDSSRYILPELHKMVAEDADMQDLTRDEKAAYVAILSEHCDKKVSSVQANNIATAQDVLTTTERVVKELNNLHVRTGTYGTLFVVQGHINDTIQSTMHGTDNSEDFWEDVYESLMADVL
ncbi:uncharacterized protein BJ212DRAFT_1283120 [Suillus subaureus]|uniref:Uncharacterized protein n=1 Tax=Suillus subaureus TaxID=48587 RepID=A0A9P7DXJ1_9AGAM|nr:uncharacterized protein BJ212DRAFT_1283120 [Suillus subaureus]KAG1805955.1 hypothetical protein BJ212DRAFT_1283120 [Suillus subaureus]